MTERTCSTNPTTMCLQICRNTDFASFPKTFHFVKLRVRPQLALHTALSAEYQTQQTNNQNRHFENAICIPHDRIIAVEPCSSMLPCSICFLFRTLSSLGNMVDSGLFPDSHRLASDLLMTTMYSVTLLPRSLGCNSSFYDAMLSCFRFIL